MESRSGSRLRLVVVFLATTGWAISAHAVNFGDMMNPGKWFGSGSNRDDGPYGYGAPGYGYGAPAYGYGAPAYGYGAPGAYGAPYGYGQPPATAPAYGAPAVPAAPAATTPAPSDKEDSEARIKALEKRIQELEAAQRPSQPASMGGYSGTPLPMQSMPRTPQGGAVQQQSMMPGGGSPTFRPMGQQ